MGAGRPLALRRWHRIWLVVDPAAKTVRVGQAGVGGGARDESVVPLPPETRIDAASPLLIGARAGTRVC